MRAFYHGYASRMSNSLPLSFWLPLLELSVCLKMNSRPSCFQSAVEEDRTLQLCSLELRSFGVLEKQTHGFFGQ